jgi:hypothetical protein
MSPFDLVFALFSLLLGLAIAEVAALVVLPAGSAVAEAAV